MVRYGPGEHTWFGQQHFIEEINGFNRLKWLDEETLRAMVRTPFKDGTPGDDKRRFVLQFFR